MVASTVAAVLAGLPLRPTLDEEYLAGYLAGMPPDDRSLWSTVRRTPRNCPAMPVGTFSGTGWLGVGMAAGRASIPSCTRDRPGEPTRGIKAATAALPIADGPAPPTMTASAPRFPLEGGCDCGQVRYRLVSPPLVVHCCHCRWCQRESGASFALNAMVEADRVEHLGIEPELVDTPSASGAGQVVARCPRCRIAIWSNYAGAGPLVRFVRVGTLDQPDALPPDIHIFTASKQPWVVLPPGVPAVSEYYDRKEHWPAASLERREAMLSRIDLTRPA